MISAERHASCSRIIRTSRCLWVYAFIIPSHRILNEVSVQIKDNIGLGDPDNAKNDEKIEEAARLGGAEEFISRLPEGFDTYLERPVPDMYSGSYLLLERHPTV